MSTRSLLLAATMFIVAVSPVSALEIDHDPARAAALRPCDTELQHGRQPQAQRCYRALLAGSPAALVRAEASWALGDLKTANTLFRAAAAAEGRSARVRVRWGELYLAAHQYAEAARLFSEALQLEPNSVAARLGMIRLGAESFEGGAPAELAALMSDNPQQLDVPLLLARLKLEQGETQAAAEYAGQALSLADKLGRPPLEALSLLAAVELFAGRDPQPHIERALKFNPRYGDIYLNLSHFELMRRRYKEAAGWLQRAIEIEPDNWQAYEELGVNQLRLGDTTGARRALERAYSGDPFSAKTVNTLRVLDSLPQYELIKTTEPSLVLQLHRKESAALRPYVETLVRQSIASFSTRYGYQPVDPITVEIYPNHDDFAVRTAGLPGIGLLGVTFGSVVALDSPSGRSTGDFHWGSTLWHEMAHVFTLSITQNRVPRWLSEGISVYEEWRTGPTPGVEIAPRYLDAFAAGKFLPIARLDEGFIRPAYEGQVQVAYMQAGLTCLYIEQRHGFPKLAALLREFTRDNSTEAALQTALGVSGADFDTGFAAFIRQRFAAYLADPKKLRTLTQAAEAALGQKNFAAAIRDAQAAIELLPEYISSDNAYVMLAAAQLDAGDKAAAIRALQSWRKAGGWEPTITRKLAALLQESGRTAEALEVREAVNYSDPLAAPDHALLGDLELAHGRAAEALREFTVLLALDTQDPASAHLGVARAELLAGNRPLARRHVLQALEIAPHFRPAQNLLLELRGENAP